MPPVLTSMVTKTAISVHLSLATAGHCETVTEQIIPLYSTPPPHQKMSSLKSLKTAKPGDIFIAALTVRTDDKEMVSTPEEITIVVAEAFR